MSKASEIKLEVNLPQIGFPKTLYFNRIRVDRDDGLCLVQFGLIVASDLVDTYSCVLTNDVLRQNQQSLLGYVKKLGPAIVDDALWKGATASRKADIADVVTMSCRGDVAETIFYVFSMCAATNMTKAVTTGDVNLLPSQPLVLLRSTTALQKQLITALYEGI